VPEQPQTAPLPARAFAADSVILTHLTEGVTHLSMHLEAGPWAVNLLTVDLDRCTQVRAVKGFAAAIGREKTSVLLSRLNDTVNVIAGVNADFFRFDPPGVPVGAHVSRGRVVTPPAAGRPVLAIDSSGRARIAILSVNTINALAVLTPFHPIEAVGGRPVVVRDSQPTAEANDTSAFSVTRHPRTVVGLSRGGHRLLLVTIDGRQPGYSVGMSLAEVATLMLALGAREAVNLDGGGSTAMVISAGQSLRVINRPSDAQGERAVGNALAIVRGC
jgi:exopolysaccharide biosynthesis protein